jgi:hypothetical protein
MDGPGYGEEEEPLYTVLGKVQNTLNNAWYIKILYLFFFYNSSWEGLFE